MKKIRIGNVKFDGKKELSLLYKNNYFGKKDKYLKDGYVQNEGFLSKGACHIDEKLFGVEELNYVVADVETDSEGPKIISVGTRIAELTDEDYSDLRRVVSLIVEAWNGENNE